jgi:hypothetical protein
MGWGLVLGGRAYPWTWNPIRNGAVLEKSRSTPYRPMFIVRVFFKDPGTGVTEHVR